MANPVELPHKAVAGPQDVSLNCIGNVPKNVPPDSDYTQFVAVHTGQLVIGFQGGHAGNVVTGDVFSFVPYGDGKVQKFDSTIATPPKDIIVDFDVAAIAALASYEDRGEEDWTISGVEGFTAQLVPLNAAEPFGPHILVLRVSLAGMKTIIHRVSYQVTVKLAIFNREGGAPRPDLMELCLNPNMGRFQPKPNDIPPKF
jgi:hypothetical protein